MWQPVSSAPFNRDLELAVIDGDGPHALVFPCRRILDGWTKAETKERIDLRPTHWRPYTRTRAFEPHQLQAMLRAFDVVCAQLRLPNEGGWTRKRVASMIFELAMTGETDEKRLVTKTLAEFRLEEDAPAPAL
jgi:hypothetical protein